MAWCGPEFIVDDSEYVAGTLEAEAWRSCEVTKGVVVHIILAERRLVEGLLPGHLSPARQPVQHTAPFFLLLQVQYWCIMLCHDSVCRGSRLPHVRVIRT